MRGEDRVGGERMRRGEKIGCEERRWNVAKGGGVLNSPS